MDTPCDVGRPFPLPFVPSLGEEEDVIEKGQGREVGGEVDESGSQRETGRDWRGLDLDIDMIDLERAPIGEIRMQQLGGRSEDIVPFEVSQFPLQIRYPFFIFRSWEREGMYKEGLAAGSGPSEAELTFDVHLPSSFHP